MTHISFDRNKIFPSFVGANESPATQYYFHLSRSLSTSSLFFFSFLLSLVPYSSGSSFIGYFGNA